MIKLTILGHYAGYPGEQGGCSSYLVRTPEQTVLLDCGPGSFGPLQQVVPFNEVDAIWISHLHTDHYLDLFPYALALLSRVFVTEPKAPLSRIPLYVPEGMGRKLLEISKALGLAAYTFPPIPDPNPAYEELRLQVLKTGDFFSVVFQVREYVFDSTWQIGSLEFTTREVAHNIPAAALRITSAGASLTYSSDTGVCTELIDLVEGSDLFLCEATVSSPGFHEGTHMSPMDAAEVALKAGVSRLVLTHLNPWVDPAWAVAQAEQLYSGEVTAACLYDSYDI